VLESRDSENATRRRRECLKCQKRFTTYERIQSSNIIIIKKDGRKEPFDRDKLMVGLSKACTKRNIPVEKIEKTVDAIERELRRAPKHEVKVGKIGTIVLRKLKSLDKVAYIRFASVYKSFDDLKEFEKTIKKLK